MNKTEGKARKNLMLSYSSLLLRSGFGPPIGAGREERKRRRAYSISKEEEEYTDVNPLLPLFLPFLSPSGPSNAERSSKE